MLIPFEMEPANENTNTPSYIF